jgi:predicted nucleic acid-binding protein
LIAAVIHFDTNFLIDAAKPGTRPHLQLRNWIQTGEPLGISAVAWAEFLCGPLAPPDLAVAQILFPSQESFLGADAVQVASLFNRTGRRSRSLADCMIAAVAIRCGAKLATSNQNDFQPFTPFGLLLA